MTTTRLGMKGLGDVDHRMQNFSEEEYALQGCGSEWCLWLAAMYT